MRGVGQGEGGGAGGSLTLWPGPETVCVKKILAFLSSRLRRVCAAAAAAVGTGGQGGAG